MVSRAAVLPVVVVVGDQMRVDIRLLQDLGKGVVEGLEGAPAPVQEGQPPGEQVAARGMQGSDPT